ncbi:MAG: hypothetical protein JWR85_2002 [Marmoricola sp.]|nr:hypothetical protein [Marmoricola sp.]
MARKRLYSLLLTKHTRGALCPTNVVLVVAKQLLPCLRLSPTGFRDQLVVVAPVMPSSDTRTEPAELAS